MELNKIEVTSIERHNLTKGFKLISIEYEDIQFIRDVCVYGNNDFQEKRTEIVMNSDEVIEVYESRNTINKKIEKRRKMYEDLKYRMKNFFNDDNNDCDVEANFLDKDDYIEYLKQENKKAIMEIKERAEDYKELYQRFLKERYINGILTMSVQFYSNINNYDVPVRRNVIGKVVEIDIKDKEGNLIHRKAVEALTEVQDIRRDARRAK